MMKKFFFIVSLITAVSMWAGTRSDARPFNLAGDQDEAPFGYMNEKNEVEGIFVDIITEAFKRMDIPVEYNAYPWKRAQHLVKTGKADGMITIVTPERLTYIVPSQEPVVEIQMSVFAKKDNPKIDQIMNAKRLEDLKGLKILDYIGDGWGEKNLSGLDVDRGGSLSLVLKKLAAGRGDVFIQTKIITKYTIKQLIKDPKNNKFPLGMIINAPHAMENTTFKLLIGKTSPFVTILPKFNETLKGMREDGTLQQIYDKFTAY